MIPNYRRTALLAFALTVGLACPVSIITATPALLLLYLFLAMPAGAAAYVWLSTRKVSE